MPATTAPTLEAGFPRSTESSVIAIPITPPATPTDPTWLAWWLQGDWVWERLDAMTEVR